MCFEAARSLPDGSWDSKHEAGRLQGLHRRVEREGAAWDPGMLPRELAGFADAWPSRSIGCKDGAAFS